MEMMTETLFYHSNAWFSFAISHKAIHQCIQMPDLGQPVYEAFGRRGYNVSLNRSIEGHDVDIYIGKNTYRLIDKDKFHFLCIIILRESNVFA